MFWSRVPEGKDMPHMHEIFKAHGTANLSPQKMAKLDLDMPQILQELDAKGPIKVQYIQVPYCDACTYVQL